MAVGPSLSVVIPCYNEAQRLPGLLDALAGQTHPPDEILVVDGGSPDGTAAAAEGWGAAHPARRLRVLANPERHIPHALNRGIAAAQSEVVARLDGHCRPAPDYLERCLRALADSGAEVVGGGWDVRPGGPGPVAAAIARAASSPLGAGDAQYRRLAGAEPGAVDTVPFGCFRRATWEAVGGFDESLLTNEDYDFNWRVRQRGGRVWLDPRIRCEYYARASLGALARQYWRYGWWKAQMLRRQPQSLRGRQAAPAAWAAVALLGWLPALVWRPWLWAFGGLWSIYLLVLAGDAVRRAGGALAQTVALAGAYVVIHFGWGLGFWAGLILGRRHSRSR
ncbi:MAG: glycosyltransferase family 2 protein [Anaerolineales bacterium]|nr:glycosyltransferase family 2 protein [Anaerolineales bacterium]